jgi:hypothetical protein
LFVSGKPYRREGPVAELVNDAIAVTETVADLDGVESARLIVFELLHVLDHLVNKWRI